MAPSASNGGSSGVERPRQTAPRNQTAAAAAAAFVRSPALGRVARFPSRRQSRGGVSGTRSQAGFASRELLGSFPPRCRGDGCVGLSRRSVEQSGRASGEETSSLGLKDERGGGRSRRERRQNSSRFSRRRCGASTVTPPPSQEVTPPASCKGPSKHGGLQTRTQAASDPRR